QFAAAHGTSCVEALAGEHPRVRQPHRAWTPSCSSARRRRSADSRTPCISGDAGTIGRAPPQQREEERMDEQPQALPLDPDGIPEELKSVPRWVPWAYQRQKGAWEKTPVWEQTDARWGPFADALRASQEQALGGLQFALDPDEGILAVVLQECRDPATGQI